VKAIRISHFGPPDVLVYVDEPVPQPKSGEAVVEVHAAGVGPWDAWMQEGKTGQSLPFTPTQMDDCVRGCARIVPLRTPSQFRQLQFHCGKPPPAPAPRTRTRIWNLWLLTEVCTAIPRLGSVGCVGPKQRKPRYGAFV